MPDVKWTTPSYPAGHSNHILTCAHNGRTYTVSRYLWDDSGRWTLVSERVLLQFDPMPSGKVRQAVELYLTFGGADG